MDWRIPLKVVSIYVIQRNIKKANISKANISILLPTSM